MKNLLLVLSVLLSTSLSAVEYGQLRTNSSIEDSYLVLGDGDLFTVIGFPSWNGLYIYIFDLGLDVQRFAEDAEYSGIFDNDYTHFLGRLVPNDRPSIVGPAIVALPTSVSYSTAFISYSLLRKNEYQNSNVFSVLGDSNSTHNIVVETSTDLENWTPVHSSGLTGSSEQIYVRTRISTSE